MDFSIPERVRRITGQVRDFVDREVIPLERGLFARGFGAVQGDLKRLRGRVREMGLFPPHLPEEWGGGGLSLLEFAHVGEVLGRSPLGHYVFGCQAPDAGNIEILHKYGTPEQQARWLEPLARGELRSLLLDDRARNRRAPTRRCSSCTARRDGDDYVIDGHKWFTTSADGAAFAIVMAVTNPEARAARPRASMIIVPTDTPGFELVRNITIMGDAGEGWASHAEIRYSGVRVPIGQPLGGEGAGFVIAQERLGPGRIHHCMRWIGICERAFDTDVRARRASARSTTARRSRTRQIVQAWIAEAAPRSTPPRLMVLHAAWTIDHEGSRRARATRSRSSSSTSPTCCSEVLDRAIQVHGALGITDDTAARASATRTSAAPASTTVPTRSTRWSSPAASSRATGSSSDGDGVDAPTPGRCGPARSSTGLALAAYPRARCRRPRGAAVEQFPGGHSNLTYLVHHRRSRVRAAPAAVRQQGEVRARHGPRGHGALAARAGLRARRARSPYCDDAATSSARRSI